MLRFGGGIVGIDTGLAEGGEITASMAAGRLENQDPVAPRGDRSRGSRQNRSACRRHWRPGGSTFR